jgi:hypothetical protein
MIATSPTHHHFDDAVVVVNTSLNTGAPHAGL